MIYLKSVLIRAKQYLPSASGAMSSRIAQLNMIDILYTACINRNISQNVRMFSHNRLDTERA